MKLTYTGYDWREMSDEEIEIMDPSRIVKLMTEPAETGAIYIEEEKAPKAHDTLTLTLEDYKQIWNALKFTVKQTQKLVPEYAEHFKLMETLMQTSEDWVLELRKEEMKNEI